MAANFRISRRIRGSVLQIRLMGDFDGTSAYELIRAVERALGSGRRININTNGLKKIYPFGCGILGTNLKSAVQAGGKLVFSGSKADEIAPAWCHIENGA